MKSARNLVRFLALLMALALFVAASLAATPLFALVWAVVFLAVCWCGMSPGKEYTASSARAGPASSDDVLSSDQFTLRERRRQWAREYPVGFRSCRITTSKFDRSEPMIQSNPSTSKPPGTTSLLEPTVSRKTCCNLFAFNANDQGLRARMVVA